MNRVPYGTKVKHKNEKFTWIGTIVPNPKDIEDCWYSIKRDDINITMHMYEREEFIVLEEEQTPEYIQKLYKAYKDAKKIDSSATSGLLHALNILGYIVNHKEVKTMEYYLEKA